MDTNQIDIDAYKKAWFTFEEIQWIMEAKQNIIDWEVYTEEEIYDFIDNELLSKYKINA